jgi:threonine synthase
MLEFLEKMKKEKSIWRYANFYAQEVLETNQLVLDDGDTPLEENEEANRLLKFKHLYFKREDENETGSLKGRSLAYQMSLAKQRGATSAVISTSGNAGIAAAAYAKEAGMKMFIFISPDTENAKIADMQKYDPIIIKSDRAIRFANYVAARYKIPNLRPSRDEDSIEGFKSVAFEIAEQTEGAGVDAVFTFVTSGSSFIGMHRGFQRYFEEGRLKKLPRMYAVQTGEIFSIAEEFVENDAMIGMRPQAAGEGKPAAGQLGVKHTPRKDEILDIIKKTDGRGVYVRDEDIKSAQEFLKARKIETSLEGCASFAALVRLQNVKNFNTAVCIFSGKKRKEVRKIDEEYIYRAESFDEVDDIVGSDSI